MTDLIQALEESSVSLGSYAEYYQMLPAQYSPSQSFRKEPPASPRPLDIKQVDDPPPPPRSPVVVLKEARLSIRSNDTGGRTEPTTTTTSFSLGETTSPASTALDVPSLSSIPTEEEDEEYHHVRVAVRLCPTKKSTATKKPVSSPLRRSRRLAEETPAWTVEHHEESATMIQKDRKRNNTYSLDAVFEEDTSTEQVYSEFCRPIVQAVATGRHGTILAYGRTGSGKTYTMQGNQDNQGIIAMAATDLFRRIQATNQECSVRAQYFEIYNEQIRDLLASDGESDDQLPALSIKETDGTVTVNAHEEKVLNVNDVLGLLQRGSRNRTRAATNLNAQSSRSHAIFRLTLECRDNPQTMRVSVLNLVDLAGSEKGQGGAATLRMREGGKINQSLLSLSRVIHALSLPEKKRPKHIGYRDSKLTRILQSSLSGEACTAILCCASASRAFLEETRSTLKFATSAKMIEVKPTVNEVVDQAAIVCALQRELTETRVALRKLQVQVSARPTTDTDDNSWGGGMMAFGLIPVDSSERSVPTSERSLSNESSDASSEAVMREDNADPDVVPLTKDGNNEGPPVSEVFVMMDSAPAEGANPTERLEDAEQRARFLENKLEATDNLVETLFQSLKKANHSNQELHLCNEQLRERIARLEERVELLNEEKEALVQLHMLLKHAVYAGLALFLCGQTEFFMGVVLFLWLSL